MTTKRAAYQKQLKERHKNQGRTTVNTILSLEATQALNALQQDTGWKKVQLVNAALVALHNNRELLKPEAPPLPSVQENLDELRRTVATLEARIMALEQGSPAREGGPAQAQEQQDRSGQEGLLRAVAEVWKNRGMLMGEELHQELPRDQKEAIGGVEALERFVWENLEDLTRLSR